MKFICSKENLNNAINISQKAVSTKTNLQVLEGILFETEDNKIKLSSNDLEIALECCIDAEIIEPGITIINSKIIGEIVRKLPNEDITFEQKNSKVILECANSHFEITSLGNNGFPKIPEVKNEMAITLSQEDFKNMLKRTLFAIGTNEERKIFTGSLIEYMDNYINVVAIDGFRMALRKKTLNDSECNYFKAVVPGKALNEITKILTSSDSTVQIYGNKNQIMFDFGNYKMASKLLEGEYINYNAVANTECKTEIILKTRSLLSSIERASIITSEDNKFPIKMSVNDDQLIITSSNETNFVREFVDIEMNGELLEISFNPKFFMDALKNIDSEEIKIMFSSNIGPCLIKPIDSDEFIYMILPVRTS